MSESPLHHQLVIKLRDTIRNRSDVAGKLVVAEDYETSTTTPTMPEGYRPDVYYEDCNTLIIGEAKTPNDIDNGHSRAQIESYVNFLVNRNDIKNRALYIAVHNQDIVDIRRLFRKMPHGDVKTYVIVDFGYCEEVK